MKTLKLSIILLVFLSTITLYGGKMEGEWITVYQIRGGIQEVKNPVTVIIKNGEFKTTNTATGKLSEIGNISEIISASSNQYDIEMTEGDNWNGEYFHGIFSISADTLFTCVNPKASGERPIEFKSTKDNGNLLVKWVRKSVSLKIKKAQDIEIK